VGQISVGDLGQKYSGGNNASRRKMIPLVSAALDARIYPAC
jgi:hypothetical protein